MVKPHICEQALGRLMPLESVTCTSHIYSTCAIYFCILNMRERALSSLYNLNQSHVLSMSTLLVLYIFAFKSCELEYLQFAINCNQNLSYAICLSIDFHEHPNSIAISITEK